MKKYIVILMLFTLVFSLFACETTVEKTKTDIHENESEQPKPPAVPDSAGSELYAIRFYNLDDFKKYISDENNREKHYYVNESAYINFDSIVPNSEIAEMGIMGKNWYSTFYINVIENDNYSFSFTVAPYNNNFSDGVKYTCNSMDELRELELPTSDYVRLNIGDHTFIYFGKSNSSLTTVRFFIDKEYIINFHWRTYCTKDDYTPAQYEFLSAIVPAYGATDDSVIAMLDRIKALIPES